MSFPNWMLRPRAFRAVPWAPVNYACRVYCVVMGATQSGATAAFSLMAFIGAGPVQGLIKKRLLRGSYLRFADFVSVSAYVYQAGALIARAKLDKLMILAQMVTRPGREQEMLDWAKDLAKTRFDQYVDVYGQEPWSLLFLCTATEYWKAGVLVPFAGVGGRITETNTKQVSKMAAVKIPVEDGLPRIEEAMLEGLGFGATFPELVEKWYREENEPIDEELWSRAAKHGLLPETPTNTTLMEQEEVVLSMVAAYAQAYHPELVDALGLTDLVA